MQKIDIIPAHKIDIKNLQKHAEDYVNRRLNYDWPEDDTDEKEYIFEVVIKTFYGKDIFDKLRHL